MNDTWMTIKEVSQWLKVTDQTIRNWIAEGTLPAYQVNKRGRILIKEEDIQGVIEAGEFKPKRNSN